MSARQFITDQVTNVPSFESPALMAAPIVAGAGLVIESFRRFGKTDEAAAAPFSNPALLEDTLEQAHVPTGRKARRWQRIGSLTMTLAGASLMVGGLASQPYVESDTVHSDDQVVFLVDSSQSMLATHDMQGGQTRTAATVQALKHVSYNGSAAVEEFAGDYSPTIPMSTDWKSHLEELGKGKVVANGGNISDALIDAASRFTGAKNGTAQSEHTIVVISDGSKAGDGQKLSAVEAVLAERDIKVKTIVPGTPNGTYHKVGEPVTDSGAAPEFFTQAGEKDVQTASSQEQLTKAVNKVAKPGKTTGKRDFWYVPTAVGAVIAGLGIRKDYRQRTGKII